MNLTPLKFNQKPDIQSVKAAKFIHVGTERIPIGDVDLKEFAKAYFQARREEITKEKVDEFIKNF